MELIKFIRFVYCFFITVPQCYKVYSGPIVQTSLGAIEGTVQTSRNGRYYHSFRGIPYAKPPVGPLRFKNPIPIEPWNGTWNATVDGPFCAQKNFLFFDNPPVTGQEDCLYLNVYVPVVKNPTVLPVMVFFYGGGFITGQSTSTTTGPEYFMDKDVILVTFNYRLGLLAMLSTLDDNAPGNLNLKDQVVALKWVRNNIKSFGGSNQKVTIFGESTGASSVHLHMLNPISKALFKRAILQSGSALQYYVIPHNEIQANVTALQAQFVGCGETVGDNVKLVECLQNVNVTDLLNSVDKFKVFNNEPFYIYTLVLENKTEGNPDAFITENTLDILEKGDYEPVPVITGVMQNEGLFSGAPYIRDPTIREEFNTVFDKVFPIITNLNFSTTEVPELWNNITNFYLNGEHCVKENDTENNQGVIDIIGDRRVVYAVYQNIKLLLQKSKTPVWVYNIAYKGQYSYSNARTNDNDNDTIIDDFGASHADDLIYLFKTPALIPKLQEPTDIKLSHFLIDSWTSFAIYGDPNVYTKLNWAPSNPAYSEIHYLNITGSAEENEFHFEIMDDFFYDRMHFWASQDINENIKINTE